MTSPSIAARALFDRLQHAVLCTAHADLGGWPFGSITPHAVLPSGDATLFLSEIAEHTKNLARDGRACLFVADPAAQAQPQAGWRLAIQARVRRAGDTEGAAAEACYFGRFPRAEAMRQAHGFHCWIAEVDCVRWIAGFGEMGWISRAEWTGQPDPLAPKAAAIVAHLNRDHADAVLALARQVSGRQGRAAEVLALDRGGLWVGVTDERTATVRVPFAAVADTPEEVRAVFVSMLHAARADR